MGILDEIKKRTTQFNQDIRNIHPGSWSIAGTSLPDFGISEIFRPVQAAEPLQKERSLIDEYRSNVPDWTSTIIGRPIDQNNYAGGTSGTSGVSQTSGAGSSQDLGMIDRAAQERQASLDAVLGRLALMRDIASRNIERARGVKEEVLGNIASTYGGLRSEAGTRKTAALENLAQEELGVQNLYGRAGGTARRAMESALLKNRMLARAMNRLDSSFYEGAQTGAIEEGRKSIADLATEEAGKRAAIGTRKTETENWFEQHP